MSFLGMAFSNPLVLGATVSSPRGGRLLLDSDQRQCRRHLLSAGIGIIVLAAFGCRLSPMVLASFAAGTFRAPPVTGTGSLLCPSPAVVPLPLCCPGTICRDVMERVRLPYTALMATLRMRSGGERRAV